MMLMDNIYNKFNSNNFWDGTIVEKKDALNFLITQKKYEDIVTCIYSYSGIDNTAQLKYADKNFARFISLVCEVELDLISIVPFLLDSISGKYCSDSFKADAKHYLQKFISENYGISLKLAKTSPNLLLWRKLVKINAVETTNEILELLLERGYNKKKMLRIVLSETKLDIFTLLDKMYPQSEQSVQIEIIRILQEFKNNAIATRLLNKIQSTELNKNVLRIFSNGNSAIKLSRVVAYDGRRFIISDPRGNAQFSVDLDKDILTSSTFKLLYSDNYGDKFAKSVYKKCVKFFIDYFYTGNKIALSDMCSHIHADGLFSQLAEKFLYVAYNANNVPEKLFTFKAGEVVNLLGVTDANRVQQVAFAHPIELGSNFKRNYAEHDYIMKRDCFVLSKDEKRFSKLRAFGDVMVDKDYAKMIARKYGCKITVIDDIPCITVRRGDYFCVYTFAISNATLLLDTFMVYKYADLVKVDRSVHFKGALPLQFEKVPARIISEFLLQINMMTKK